MPGPLLLTPLLTSAAGATTLTLGEGLGIGSAVLSGFGTLFSGIQQAQANRTNAAIANREADQTETQYAADAAQQRRDNSRKLGAAEAAYGAAGVDLSGSPLDVLADMATEGELSRRLTLYKGGVEADRLRMQSAIDRSNAGSAIAGGAIGAGSTFLTQGLNTFADQVKPTDPATPAPLTVPGVPRPKRVRY